MVPEGEFRVKTKPFSNCPRRVYGFRRGQPWRVSVCSSSAVETRRLTVCTTEAQAAVGACHGHRVSGREDSRPDCHRRYDGLRDTGY